MSSTHGVATRRTRKVLAGVAAAGVTASLLAVAGTSPAQALPDPSGNNPDTAATCGLDVVLVLDESNSMGIAANQVKTAAAGMLDAFQDTNSRVAVVKFTRTATVAAPLTDDTVTTNHGGVLGNAIAGYAPTPINGQTNWDDAFRVATGLLPAPGGKQQLIVLVGDGQPNVYNTSVVGGVPVTSVQRQPSQAVDAYINPAISKANAFKTSGGHVLGVLLGTVLPSGVANVSRVTQMYKSSPQYTSSINYNAVTGNTWTNDASGSLHDGLPADDPAKPGIPDATAFDAARTDFLVKPSTSELTADLKGLATFTCAKSLSVTQRGNTPNIPADLNGNPGAGYGVTVEAVGVTFTTPTSAPSDASGTSLFQWMDSATPAKPTVRVTMKPSYVFRSATCTINGTAAAITAPATVSGVTSFAFVDGIGATDRANCVVSSRYTGKYTTFLTLKPLAATVGFGGAVTMSGLVRKPLANVKGVYPPIAGARVTIQTRPLWATTAAWTTIARTSTTAKGTFAYVVKKPYTTYNRAFRVIVSGSATQLSTNKIAAIKVAPIVTGTLARTSTRIVVAGVVVPSYKGKAIYLQKYVGGRYVTIATKTISSTSRYSFTIVRPAKAAYYRTLVMPTTSRAVGVSRRLVG